MRIIKRTSLFDKSILFVVQDLRSNQNIDKYMNAIAYIGGPSKYIDLGSFTTLKAAEDFLYATKNDLKPGEELVTGN